MVYPQYLAKIKHFLEPYYPGYIAVIDIAALKIKNDLLGHLVGDKEIEDLEQIIYQHIDLPEFVVRVGGDEWLLFFPSYPEKQLKAIAQEYSKKEVAVIVGWQCTGKRRFRKPKQIRETKQSTLYRGIKICYLAINKADELSKKSEILFYNSGCSHRDFPVNIPVETPAKITEFPEQSWSSIDLALPQRYCPFCQYTEFNWEDWVGGIFGGEGNCQKCRAEVHFSSICQPET